MGIDRTNSILHLLRQNRLDEGVSLCQKMLAHDPNNSVILHLLGVIYYQRGDAVLAEHLIRQAIALAPMANADYYINLGVVLKMLGKLKERIECYQKSIEINPDVAAAWLNLAGALNEVKRYQEAETAARKAVDIDANNANAWINLGNSLRFRGLKEESGDCYQRALHLSPGHLDALYNLGNLLDEMGSYPKAVDCFIQSIKISPEFSKAKLPLLYNQLLICRWEGVAEGSKEISTLLNKEDMLVMPLSFLALPNTTAAEQRRCAEIDSRHKAAMFLPFRQALNFKYKRSVQQKLRIGYISADFRQHPVSGLVVGFLPFHDHSRFEVHGYSYGPNDQGSMRSRIKNNCDYFNDITALSFEDAAKKIHKGGIDILVDLTGYTRDNRAEIMAMRPAPIQVSYLGYPGTMGADFYDYLIGDPFVTPLSKAEFYSEKLVLLPDVYQVGNRERVIASTPSRSDCGLPEDAFIFCCLNNNYKILPDVFDSWMRLLTKVPNSILWLLESNQWAPDNLRYEAATRGIAPGRLVFMKRLPMEEYLARARLADLYLDTFPYNAGATANDMLFAGLPVVTCSGDGYVSRMAGSLLTAFGFPNLVTYSLPEYEKLAFHLATTPHELAAIRKAFEKKIDDSVLFDGRRFAKNLEVAYEKMWGNYSRGNAPTEIIIKEHTSVEAKSSPTEMSTKTIPAISLATLQSPPQSANTSSNFDLHTREVSAPTPQEINMLVALFNKGCYTELESSARAMTEHFPCHGFGWKVLGIALKQQGRPAEALIPMQKATELLPGDVSAFSNLGVILKALGKFSEAETSYRQALRIKPDHAESHNNLGNLLLIQGRPAEAEASHRRALDINPEYFEAHSNLGNSLKELGRLNEAEASYRHALIIKPDFAEAHFYLGNALQEQSLNYESETCYLRALETNPGYAEALNNLGNVLRTQGRLTEAESSYQRALEINPEYADAHSNLGVIFQERGRISDAEASYRRALEIKPDFAGALNNLGDILWAQDRIAEAEANFRRAVGIKPDFAEAYGNLALVCFLRGNESEAYRFLEKALSLSPNNAKFRLMQAMLALPIAPQTKAASVSAPIEFDLKLGILSDWLDLSPAHRNRFSKVVGSQQPFFLAYRDGNHVARLSRYGDLITDKKNLPIIPPSARRIKPRLVIVSSHFRRHSVWDIIIRGLLVHLDRTQFEVVLYHVGQIEDEETKFAKSLADIWRDSRSATGLNEWLDMMTTDKPDVVFYPEIGMDPLSLRLAACRLAPLQIASWGHPITTGLPTIDLYFSGEMLEPPEGASHYREKLIRLPGTGCCTTPIEFTPSKLPDLEAELALRQGVRFLIAQSAIKFDPDNDALYANIASGVGESTFILLKDHKYPWATDRIVTRFYRAFYEMGLDPENHLLVIPWVTREQFYGLLDLCDVYLDCPSFSGYTTAWQAAHRGLPVVTLEGKHMRQRLAAGLLRKINVTDTIAASVEEYVAIAVRMAEECSNPTGRHIRRQSIKTAATQSDYDINVVRVFEKNVVDALDDRRRGDVGCQ